ncbi:hypothetical protein COSO111634_03395 [Corallococcus soli]
METRKLGKQGLAVSALGLMQGLTRPNTPASKEAR